MVMSAIVNPRGRAAATSPPCCTQCCQIGSDVSRSGGRPATCRSAHKAVARRRVRVAQAMTEYGARCFTDPADRRDRRRGVTCVWLCSLLGQGDNVVHHRGQVAVLSDGGALTLGAAAAGRHPLQICLHETPIAELIERGP